MGLKFLLLFPEVCPYLNNYLVDYDWLLENPKLHPPLRQGLKSLGRRKWERREAESTGVDEISSIPFSLGEDDDDDECGEEKLPSCFDYVMHFLTVFWKVLFAFVPPTEYWNGWACFIVSILMIGILTAFIGDLASHFGCTIGLKDSVTAVVFVALGTSVPGREYMPMWLPQKWKPFHLLDLFVPAVSRAVLTNPADERQKPKAMHDVTASTLSWHFSRLESWSVSSC